MSIFRFFVCLFLLFLSSATFAVDTDIGGILSSGYAHNCALDDTGVVCWGDNYYGQTDVPSLSNPTQVSSGGSTTCALDDTGVVCWGNNSNGQIDMSSLINPSQISLGYDGNSCALDDTGVVCWGNDIYSTGKNDVPPLSNPTQVHTYRYNSCAFDDTGVVCWGSNDYGKTDVPPLSNPTQVSLSDAHICALDDTGVVCWGSTRFGQTDVPSLSNPRQVGSGDSFSCALDDTGVVCWGYNYFGQTDVPWLSNPYQMSVGAYHVCALDDRGVVCWGYNDYGQTDVPELTFNNHFATEITSVQTVNAIDENSGTNQVIYTAVANTPIATFRLTEDSDPALTINAITGQVTLAANPNFEAQSEYSFSIIASTSVGDSDPINLTLPINNLDEDDADTDVTSAVLDIDANGSFDALTDGLILLRYAFGLRGQSLIDDVISEDAMRNNASDIETYIETLLP